MSNHTAAHPDQRLDEYLAAHNLAPSSVATMRRSVRRFAAYVWAHQCDVTVEAVDGWEAARRAGGGAATSTYIEAEQVRRFLRWCAERGHLEGWEFWETFAAGDVLEVRPGRGI